jgi:hypothetical protein
VASKGTSGWASLGGNDPTKYQATFDLNNGTIGPSGAQQKQKVVVITDRSSGNYDVYEVGFFGQRSLIYQYNASSNSINKSTLNEGKYNNYFTGKNSNQNLNLSSGVKQATLNLAKENLSGSTSRKEYQELQTYTGYKSLSNTAEQSTVTDSEDAPLSGGEEQGSDSSDGTITGGFLAPDGFSSGSDLTFTDFGSLDGDAFLGTADDITAAGDSFAFGVANPGIVSSDTQLDLSNSFYTRQFAEDGEILQYPEADLTDFGYDYIQITGHKYTTKNTNGFGQSDSTGVFNNSFKNYSVSGKLGQVTKIIQLPMQPGISESNAVDWNEDSINEIQRRAAGIAGNAINGIRGSSDLGDLGKVFANLLGNTGEAAQKLINDNGLAPFITAYFAGQAVGANIVGRSTGQVLNKNLELLFKGPKLRQFSFNFTFTPRSDSEALTIKKMIRFFKKSMAPEVSPERIFLYTPDIFQLQYIHNSGGGHPYLNRFKPCALTNFSANYTPGNSYMTYKDGSMTQYQVTMTFSELEPIYQSDHDVAGGTGF